MKQIYFFRILQNLYSFVFLGMCNGWGKIQQHIPQRFIFRLEPKKMKLFSHTKMAIQVGLDIRGHGKTAIIEKIYTVIENISQKWYEFRNSRIIIFQLLKPANSEGNLYMQYKRLVSIKNQCASLEAKKLLKLKDRFLWCTSFALMLNLRHHSLIHIIHYTGSLRYHNFLRMYHP